MVGVGEVEVPMGVRVWVRVGVWVGVGVRVWTEVVVGTGGGGASGGMWGVGQVAGAAGQLTHITAGVACTGPTNTC